MTTIHVRFTGAPRFTGSTPGAPRQWPPAPSRVFCALVSAVQSVQGADAALQALENATLSTIHHSDSGRHSDITAYVKGKKEAIKETKGTPGKNSPAGRNSATVTMASGWQSDIATEITLPGSRTPDIPEVFYTLEQDLDNDTVDTLDQLASQVAYVGRASDHAVLSVTNDPVEIPDGLTEYLVIPTDSDNRRVSLNTWFTGYHDRLAARWSIDDRNPEATTPVHLPPHPVTPTVSTIPVRRDDSGAHSALRFVDRVTAPARIPELIETLCQATDGAALPVFDPWRGTLIGVTLTAPDHSTELMSLHDTVNAIRPVETGPRSWIDRRYRSSDLWSSITPAHGPDGNTTWARVVADIRRQTGLDPHVRVRPSGTDPERRLIGPTPGPAMQTWDVLVSLPESVSGPLRVGYDTDRGAGVLDCHIRG